MSKAVVRHGGLLSAAPVFSDTMARMQRGGQRIVARSHRRDPRQLRDLTLPTNIVSFAQLREVNAHHNSLCVHLTASSLAGCAVAYGQEARRFRRRADADFSKWEVFGMSISKTLIAVLALAVAIAFSPLSQLQAATVSPGSNPGVDNAIVKVAKKSAKKKAKKSGGKKKSAKKAKSKGPGSCGAFMYYSKKDHKCADARQKK
jgi:hypothetical protein